jgi:hypothetical protein
MKKYLFFLTMVLITCCANPQPPSGGPRDKTPPVIISYFPENETKNFDGDKIKLKFNKYMDKTKVNENVFISPSLEVSFDWSGKSLDIEFEQELDSNTTYVFSLGTDYTDLKQNKPNEAFTLIFSTGSYLDSCMVKGKLYDKEPTTDKSGQTGVFIYAYQINGIDEDTLNFGHTKPNYRTQVGTNGNFTLSALKEGTYRIIAIRDKYRDEVYNEGIDDFGAAPYDVNVTGDSVPIINLRIGGAEDKYGPLLFECESLFSNLLALNFSEPIDTLSVRKEAFKLCDSSGTKEISINGAMMSPESRDKLWVTTKEIPDTATLWEISCRNEPCIKDTNGNPIQDTANSVYFFAVVEKDSSTINFTQIPFKDSTQGIEILPDLEFALSLPVINDDFDSRIEILSENIVEHEYDIFWKSNNSFIIRPESKLTPLTWHKLSINLDSLCVSNGSCFKDSIIKLNFQTKDTRNYGGAKGRIKGLNMADTTIKIIFDNGKNTYIISPSDSGRWKILDLPEGKYNVSLYKDINCNKKYDYGNSMPFRHSEPFIFLEIPQEIPPRWTIEISLPKP